jgi:hypothetical protein
MKAMAQAEGMNVNEGMRVCKDGMNECMNE